MAFGTAAVNRPFTPTLDKQLKEYCIGEMVIVRRKPKHSEKILL
jgi:hypothetical protein